MLHTRIATALFLIFFVGTLWAQVTVDFTVGETTGCGSLQASFCAEASSAAGNIASYQWDLGGVSSSLKCPGRIYGTPGTYTICLTATDDKGNSKKICKEDLIKVFALPQPDFTADATVGCSPLEVTFQDQSQAPDAPIVNWIWGLGGSNSVVVDEGTYGEISSTYQLADDYAVSLTVKDANGCANTIAKENYIKVYPNPQILVSTQDTFACNAPFEVRFINSGSSNSISYLWDFGNGQVYAGFQPPPVTYTEAGTYTITVLSQVAFTGCRNTLVLQDEVSVGYPVSFSYSSDTVCAGTAIDFADESAIEADSILWDFGDGSTSDNPAPSHVYDSPGVYSVALYRFVEGCPSQKISRDLITVRERPEVTVSLDNPLGCTVPHTVNFTASSNEAVSYHWDFGDGNTSTEKSPTHTYTAMGEYEAILTATNANGCSNIAAFTEVKIAPLVASLSLNDISGCTPLNFTLSDNSSSVTPISSWSWTVSNGLTSSESQPSFTIEEIGKYDLQLIVENTLGCRDTLIRNDFIEVGGKLPVNFSALPAETCVNAPVEFTDLSDPLADSWIWTIEKGDMDTIILSQNHSFQFPDSGSYTVSLLVGYNGCTSQLVKKDLIRVAEPKASFTIEQACSDPFTVNFESSSTGADTLLWDFGVEGITSDTSSQPNPVFRFPTTGEFTVTLTAKNDSTGCTHVASRVIVVPVPKAEFSISTTEGCVPLTVQVSEYSDFASGWYWEAPGGVVSNPRAAQPSITYNQPGHYSNIQLVITDVNECQDTVLYTGDILVNEVTADFTTDPAGGCEPLTVQFSDRSSSLYGTNVAWSWEIGDNLANLSGRQVQFELKQKASYPVQLTVEDDWGCVGKKVVPDAVLVTFPQAVFTADTFSCTQNAVQFTNLSEGVELGYQWDFGDGESSTEENPLHSYSLEGLFTVCLTVTDINGCVHTLCREEYVEISNPVADFELDQSYSSCPPLLVQFNNTSKNAYNFMWDFGDESGAADLENPPHVYTRPGQYDVRLSVSSIPQCTDTVYRQGLVQLEGPTGDFTYTVDPSCVPVKVTLVGQSDDFYEYVWDLGNGDLISRPGKLDRDSIIYYYTEPGIFIPKLKLIDQGSDCEVFIEADKEILVADLQVDFVASDSILCDDESSVHFLNLSNSSTPINFLEWSFPGASPIASKEFEPRASYTKNGSYDVQLIAGNAFCRDTLRKQNYIRVGLNPVSDFSMTPGNGCEPLEVSFSDNSSVASGTVAGWFWNFGDEGTSREQNPVHTFSAGENYEINLVITTDLGCQDTSSTTLSVDKAMDVAIAEVAPICIGEGIPLMVSISDTSNITVSWNNTNSLSCPDCIDPVAFPEDTTTYVITVRDERGCQNTAEVKVDVRPFRVPVVNLSNDTTVCPGEILNLYVSGGDDVFSYQWDTARQGLSCYSNCANPIASPAGTTTYPVVVTSRNGCTNTDSVTVHVVDAYQPFASEDKTICLGEDTQLGISYGNDPLWMNPVRLDCTYCPNPMAKPVETTTYYVQVEDDIGCKITDSVVIKVIRQEDIDAGVDQQLCLGDELILAGMGEGQVSWSPATGLNDTEILNPEASPNTTTVYTIAVTNGDCILRDSVVIEVVEKTDIELAGATICAGEEAQIFVEGNATIFNWQPGDIPGVANPVVTPSETTEYTVIAQLSGCTPDTASAVVEVIPLPPVYLPPLRYAFKDEPIEVGLEVNGSGNYEFIWSPPAGLSCTDCPNPVFASDSNRVYQVLAADLETGCVYEASTQIQLFRTCSDDIFYLPNAFSPNGDGRNDVLEIQPGLISEISRFQIYDRWGMLLFETTDISRGWDGTFRGEVLDKGVYVYFIEARCAINGEKIYFSGDVTLLR